MEERRGRGLGRDPAPGPRDPEKFCSAADPAQSTEREGQQSSHKDAGLVSVSGEEVLLTERGTQQTAGTMEPPSGPASRRHVPWSRLLLAVSLFSFRTLPTAAQLTIETVPPFAAEGSDVLLLLHNVTKNPLCYAWHRGERVDNTQLIILYLGDTNTTTKGPAYSRRETLYPNGTLLIRNVTQRDTGPYTLLVTKNDLWIETQTGHLHVHPTREAQGCVLSVISTAVLPSPVITSSNSSPREHKDTLVLTCGAETQNTSYMWWINSQSLPKSTRLVTRNDTGPYVCEARNPASVSRSDPFTLEVLSPVARPSLQASNATVTEHEGPVVLTCLADETGVSIRWFFKGQSLLLAERMTLSSDKSTLTIDPVSREDAGDYQCEAFNRGNSSRSDPLRLHVTLQENTRALGVGAVIGIMVAVLLVLTPLAGLGRFIFLHRASGQNDLREHRPPATTLGHGPSGSSVSPASLPSPKPAVPIYEELLYPNTDIYCQINPKVDVVS
ncbi:hypothetical protein AB1E18_013471 [Capra hircus]